MTSHQPEPEPLAELAYLDTSAVESALLGSMMVSNDHVGAAATCGLRAEHFGIFGNQWLFRALTEMDAPYDVHLVRQQLKNMNAPPAAQKALTDAVMANAVVSPTMIPSYVRTIQAGHTARQIEQKASEIAILAQEHRGSAQELIAKAVTGFAEIAADSADANFEVADGNKVIDRMERLMHLGGMLGCPSGYEAIDRMTYGFKPGEMVVLAARPSVGKSAFACNIAANAAIRHGARVAFFSLEMSGGELTARMLSSETGFSFAMIQSAGANNDDIARLRNRKNDFKVHICEKGAATPTFIESKARALASKLGGLDLIIVDHIQIATSESPMNRYELITYVSGEMKRIAKELGCCVLALSQLRRAQPGQEDVPPTLNDLRESGAIEQDADIVMLMHREGYGKPDAPSQGDTQIIIAKNRNGRVGTVTLRHRLEIQKFVEG